MNTLPKAVTAGFFAAPQDYTTLEAHWSALINSERKAELTAAHHLLYSALRGKDWRKGFAPISRKRKLDNGAVYGWGLLRALRSLHSGVDEARLLWPFDGLVTSAILQDVRSLVPVPNLAVYHQDMQTTQDFFHQAYTIIDVQHGAIPDEVLSDA